MARPRLYATNAERQAAYRARVAHRLELAGTTQLVARIADLEAALADAERRAETAEERATRAERQVAASRDCHDELAAALRRVAVLEATITQLRAQVTAAQPTAPTGTPGLNRAARRAAERDRRRRH